MKNKKDIARRLKILLTATREGNDTASSIDNSALEYHLQRRKQMADLDVNSLEIMRKGLDVPV